MTLGPTVKQHALIPPVRATGLVRILSRAELGAQQGPALATSSPPPGMGMDKALANLNVVLLPAGGPLEGLTGIPTEVIMEGFTEATTFEPDPLTSNPPAPSLKSKPRLLWFSAFFCFCFVLFLKFCFIFKVRYLQFLQPKMEIMAHAVQADENINKSWLRIAPWSLLKTWGPNPFCVLKHPGYYLVIYRV